MKKLLMFVALFIIALSLTGCISDEEFASSSADDLYTCTHQDVVYTGVTLKAGYLNGSSGNPIVRIKQADTVVAVLIRPIDLVCVPTTGY